MTGCLVRGGGLPCGEGFGQVGGVVAVLRGRRPACRLEQCGKAVVADLVRPVEPARTPPLGEQRVHGVQAREPPGSTSVCAICYPGVWLPPGRRVVVTAAVGASLLNVNMMSSMAKVLACCCSAPTP